MALHNAEEAIFFSRYLPLVLGRLPESWRTIVGPLTPGQMWTALGVVTLIPIILATWMTLRPRRVSPVWLLLLVQATLLVNVVWHAIAAAVLFGGYAPGLITALGVNLPLSLYLLRRARREGWVGRRALLALIPGALLLHGPLVLGLLLLVERLG
jgi:hypothetical protein